jgi:hypothetical protein
MNAKAAGTARSRASWSLAPSMPAPDWVIDVKENVKTTLTGMHFAMNGPNEAVAEASPSLQGEKRS